MTFIRKPNLLPREVTRARTRSQGPGGELPPPRKPGGLKEKPNEFEEALAVYKDFMKREFMPGYRRWYEDTTSHCSNVTRLALEQGWKKVPKEMFTEFEQDNEPKWWGEGYRERYHEEDIPPRAGLLISTASHRVFDNLPNMEEFGERLSAYLSQRADVAPGGDEVQGKIPEFTPKKPEVFEKELLDMSPGEFFHSKKEEFLSGAGQEIKSAIEVNLGRRMLSTNVVLGEFPTESDYWFESLFSREVFDELGRNASRYLPEQNPEIILGGKATKDEVMFSVHDNGKGIDPKILPHIFERGFTTRKDASMGTGGFGLDCVRSIVEQVFGGKIIVESNGKKFNPKTGIISESDVTKGTRFTITYPNKSHID
ncbi:MAG: ATP-binding protein [Candidatus Altiarchaeota archaeon]